MRISSVGLTICKHSFNEKSMKLFFLAFCNIIRYITCKLFPLHNLQSNLKSDYAVLQIIFVLRKLTASIFYNVFKSRQMSVEFYRPRSFLWILNKCPSARFMSFKNENVSMKLRFYPKIQ